MPRQLPERPNLEQLKKQAKSLLHAAQQNEPAAIERFRILPAFANAAGRSKDRPLQIALHDAQSVIAREHGFPSWNALREEVDARTLSFDAAVDEFLRCATGGASGRARRLLALHPATRTASLYTAIVLGDAAAVDARLRDRPELATQPGGPQQWEPLLHACQTCVCDRPDELVTIARRLLTLGANPNGQYHWNWHPELPRTALWASVCTVKHLPLAEVLLAAGANPTDGVTPHIAGGQGDLRALDLLHRFGMNVDGMPGGVPPLVYMMLWTEKADGPRWFLEHGANPNLAWGDENEAPLHVAARRWDVAMVELIVRHGGDVRQRRGDGSTPHTVAALFGNHDVAAWLAAHGAGDELSPVERFIACCARDDRAAADAMLAANPGLRDELTPAHHQMLHRPAETGNARVLETMLSCGFDPDARDKDRVTPLHRAAMGGHPDAVRVLLAAGADVNALDGMFAATPLVWAVEGRGSHPGGDHVAVARLLIAAGSSLEWVAPAGAPGPERTHEGLIDLRRAAAAPAS